MSIFRRKATNRDLPAGYELSPRSGTLKAELPFVYRHITARATAHTEAARDAATLALTFHGVRVSTTTSDFVAPPSLFLSFPLLRRRTHDQH